MATKAKPGKKTLFQRGDGASPETFTTVGEVLGFTGPSEMADEIDVTSQDSDEMEYISSGLPDSPDIQLELNFVASNVQQQGLRTDLRNGTKRNFKVQLNDHPTNPTTFEFAGIVKGFEGPEVALKQQYKATVTIRRTGPTTVTYAPAA